MRLSNLRTGRTTSCGCRQRERSTTHGMWGSPEYFSYHAMLRRCNDPKDVSYHNYGGRGVRVCARWSGEDGFENFLADMGPRPPGKTLEKGRKKLYCKANCSWVTPRKQGETRRNVRTLDSGETLGSASRRTGIAVPTLAWRKQQGWSDHKTLTVPVRKHRKFKRPGGRVLSTGETLQAAAARIGISASRLSRRIKEWGEARAISTLAKKYSHH